MLKKGSKLLALLMAMVMLVALSACGTSGDSGKASKTPDPTSTPATTTETEDTTDATEDETVAVEEDEEVEEEFDLDKYFPGADLGGVTLKVNFQNPEKVDEADRDKWRARAKRVEEKFNVKLVFDSLEGIDWNDVPQQIITSIAAGDPILDAGDFSRYYLADLVNNGLMVDMGSAVKSAGFPEGYYKYGSQLAGVTYGFSRGVMGTWTILAYNRDLIKKAGMEKTPTEMFVEGKWSYDDFYNYMKELKSKLPSGVDTFGIHALTWAEAATYANNSFLYDPDTYVPQYLSDGTIETIEFMQKMVQDGLMRGPVVETYDDGTPKYNWNSATAGFQDGELAMAPAAPWDHESLASKFDWGVVPFPYGSKVTVKDGDYKSLEGQYFAEYHDCGIMGIIKGAGDKKMTNDQFINLVFTYYDDAAEDFIKNKGRAAKGEVIVPGNPEDPMHFTTELDQEIYYWYVAQSRFEPMQTVTVVPDPYRAIYKVCGTNENVRSTLESVIVADTWAMVDAGYVKVEDLPADLKAQIEKYTPPVTEE